MANEAVLAELDSVLAEYGACATKYGIQGSVWITVPASEQTQIIALLHAAIVRLSPSQSTYPGRAEDILRHNFLPGQKTLPELLGILQALRADYAADRIRTFQELVHSDLFADLLEAADYLLGETYKDPAAVMAGGVLEQHLRELCRKHGIDTTITTAGGDTKPKMIDTMNADLAKATAYGKIEQKQVRAWAGIRNAAAHGKFGDYDENQVRQMVTGIRDFIAKYPA